MADIYINSTFKLKRGTAARWAELNLVLEAGEPGFVLDEKRLKIGDGSTPWNDLPYIGEGEVVSAPTLEDFPLVGNPNSIYKTEQDGVIYQYDAIVKKYTPLATAAIPNIEIINGGKANGVA